MYRCDSDFKENFTRFASTNFQSQLATRDELMLSTKVICCNISVKVTCHVIAICNHL